MWNIITYLNPFARHGHTRYSLILPFIVGILSSIISELYAYNIAHDPTIVGSYILYLNVTAVIYFSVRNGIAGGLIETFISIIYYLYFLDSRQYTGIQFHEGLATIIVLGIIYTVLSVVIGFLKQRVDSLIERESDEKHKLQAIIDQLPIGVSVHDMKGKMTLANKKLHSIIGQDVPIDDFFGKEANRYGRHMVNGTPVSPNQWPISITLQTGKAVANKEFIFGQAHGKEIYVAISASMVRNQEGKPIGIASIINDITAQKELDLRKDDFINMASHELKTPITTLRLYSESLERKIKVLKKFGIQKTVSAIQSQIEKLQNLVLTLLDVSRIQTGKLLFIKERFPLHTLIADIVDDLQDVSDKHMIKFAKRTPLYVNADKFRISQVISNIVTNAMKYSPTGGDVRISLKRSGDYAEVAIKDFGVGISKKHLTKVFDRLYQVTDPSEKTYPGLGLGLYISREIIKRHRGKIWVESTKGKGSTFIFTIPL